MVKCYLIFFNYIATQNLLIFENAINDKEEYATFEIDIVLKDKLGYNLFRLNGTLSYIEKLELEKLSLSKVNINKQDTYEKVIERLEVIEEYVKNVDKEKKLKLY